MSSVPPKAQSNHDTCHKWISVLGLILLALACAHGANEIVTKDSQAEGAKDVVSNARTAYEAGGDLTSAQTAIIDAVKTRNYDRVIKLSEKAKQQAEFDQVAKEVLQNPNLGEFSAQYAVRLDAFLSSLMMILVSELGDKTFFIAAIMAMKHSRGVVLAGALGALALMTVLSAAAGFALPQFLPRMYTHYASVVLFFVFGIKMLRDAREMSDGVSEELEEVEEALNMAEKKKNPDIESVSAEGRKNSLIWTGGHLGKFTLVNTVIWQAFTLTFLAEWGDRSQIATIALAAQKDPIGVTAGGIIGHAACTGLAVTGGRMLASRISEKTVSISGGILFLVFAAHGMWQGGSALNNA